VVRSAGRREGRGRRNKHRAMGAINARPLLVEIGGFRTRNLREDGQEWTRRQWSRRRRRSSRG
jgi:hypothetical protein